MHKMSIFLLSVFLLLTAHGSYAQTAVNEHESAALLHQNGQIYLVVLVLLTIFAGIIFYLIRLEKKLNKLEKNQRN